MPRVNSDDNELRTQLQRVFGNNDVQWEYDIAERSRDLMNRSAYAPRADFAVGPFNESMIDSEKRQAISEILRVFNYQNRTIAEQVKAISSEPSLEMSIRGNPRCFLIVELERSLAGDKQKLGSLINASILGMIGIVIGGNVEITRRLERIKKYVQNSSSLGKIAWNIDNTFVTSRDALYNLLLAKEDDEFNIRSILARSQP